MNCAHCGKPVDGAVLLNDAPYHVEKCFGEGLRKYTFRREELAIELPRDLPPMTAYSLGKQHVAIIVAARRKAKKRR